MNHCICLFYVILSEGRLTAVPDMYRRQMYKAIHFVIFEILHRLSFFSIRFVFNVDKYVYFFST